MCAEDEMIVNSICFRINLKTINQDGSLTAVCTTVQDDDHRATRAAPHRWVLASRVGGSLSCPAAVVAVALVPAETRCYLPGTRAAAQTQLGPAEFCRHEQRPDLNSGLHQHTPTYQHISGRKNICCLQISRFTETMTSCSSYSSYNLHGSLGQC